MPGLPLSLPEREEILLALIADRDVSWAELARRVGRHPTTMARVVAASGGRHGYRPIVAQRSAIDLQKRGRTRVLVLACIPVTLIMTISIPEAFQSTGIWFGVAYLGVQLMVLGMQGAVAMADPAERVPCIATALAAAGAWLPGLVVVVGVAVLLGVMQAVTWRRFQRGALAHVIAGH